MIDVSWQVLIDTNSRMRGKSAYMPCTRFTKVTSSAMECSRLYMSSDSLRIWTRAEDTSVSWSDILECDRNHRIVLANLKFPHPGITGAKSAKFGLRTWSANQLQQPRIWQAKISKAYNTLTQPKHVLCYNLQAVCAPCFYNLHPLR